MQPTEEEKAYARAFWAQFPKGLEVMQNLAADPYHYEKLAEERRKARRLKRRQ